MLVDVGGTLWPNTWIPTAAERANQLAAVRQVLPGADERELEAVVTAVTTLAEEGGVAGRRGVVELLRLILDEHGWPSDPATVRRVRQGLCSNLGALVDPFAGAAELLAGVKALGLRCVVLSNTTFRDAEMYRRDFDTLGWNRWLDGCVTSVDAGCAKPARRIFEVAIGLAGAAAERCVMVGDSETADIIPALELGLRTIRVAIEEKLTDSAAHATATSLPDVLRVIRSWA